MSLKRVSTIFWDEFYVSHWVKTINGLWVVRYYTLKARNKRHARKVFFKFVPKRDKKVLSKLRISSYKFPPHGCDGDEYDGINHFWDMAATRLG